jgi:hypothetical protein
MKIPRKADLLNLQTLYKTDAKIAEALGGIPEYLVAYWRRKKGVPPYSEAKFSEGEIRELWERFGDDFRCGRELNLSKAAFYSWRRKYGLLEKPAELKLEQLELRLGAKGAEEAPIPKLKGDSPRTATAKILARAHEAHAGSKDPSDWVIFDAGAGVLAITPGGRSDMAAPSMAGPIPAADQRAPFRCTHAHGDLDWQLVEACAVLPGELITAPPSRLAGLGGTGCLVLDRGALGAKLPKVVKLEVTRRLPHQTDVEDLALTILEHGADKLVTGRIVELAGVPIERLTIDRKVKLCGLVVALGAVAALCPFDETIRRHYGRVLIGRYPQTHPDRTALYDEEHFLEGRGIEARSATIEGAAWKLIDERKPKPGGVIVGPDALPYEIEACAEMVREKTLPEGGPGLIVCPATPQAFTLAYKRGWAQTITAAGGSVVDLTLSRRLGWPGLVALAAGPTQIVYATRPGSTDPRVRFCSVPTALVRAGMAG